MQLVRDIYAAKRAAGQPVISFEFFPPKTDDGDRILLEKTLPALLQTKPDYCSVTYGAGGTTREPARHAGLAPEGKQTLPKFPGVVAWDNRMDALPTVVAFNAKLPPRTPGWVYPN